MMPMPMPCRYIHPPSPSYITTSSANHNFASIAASRRLASSRSYSSFPPPNMAQQGSNQVAAAHGPMERHHPPGDDGGNKQPPSTSMEYQLKAYLLLLATLVATVTYGAGLNLPGGAWPDTQDGHLTGDPILPDAHYARYLAFYYCNATAFASSLVACLLLLVLDEENTVWATVLRAVMVLDLFGLMGAYAAGSCRDKFTTIYASLLVISVFAYIMLVFLNSVFAYAFRGTVFAHASQWVLGKDPEKLGEGTADANEHEDEHEVLMLLATFVVTITYVAGLGPPGGFWSDSRDGHQVSDPIMQDHNTSRYQSFFVWNTTAFVASLLIIVLLMDKNLSRTISVRFVALYGFIAVALIGLVGAYAAGSCREADATIYVVSLAGAVLASIFLQVAITSAMNKEGSWGDKLLTHIRGFTSQWLKKIKKWFTDTATPSPNRDTQQADKVLERNRSLVMLLATLVVSITYTAGLDPPGGLWPDDQDGHQSGDPVLLTTHPTRYKVFFYSNSAAFVTSLVVIIMVQSRFLLKRHTLHAAMILDLFGLITAYAAGSGRNLSTSIYVVALAGVVLVYVVIHIVFFTLEDQQIGDHQDHDKLDKRREMLLLLAILAATLTYQAGLTPPGGFWSADDKFGHQAGFPVLFDNYPRRYNAFFYCNAASFMASVTLIVLLVNPTLYKPGIKCYALYVCMVVGMFGLMGAYAAGSSRHVRTSIYVFTLVAAVFAFVIIQVVIFWIQSYWKKDQPSTASAPVNKDSRVRSEEKDLREYLMLLGVLAASVTYQTGLKPPGGLWQDNNNGHTAGNSILHDIDRGRFRAFFYSNSTSFMASIVVIILLLPLNTHKLPLWPMHTAILLDMMGLLCAYAAGSTREWGTSSHVIALVVPVLAYIAAYAAWSLFSNKGRCVATKMPHDQQSQ
ncbi:uncharacterized protein LOC123445407 [Hordeum vulgare subsp. vulgare]|uniref:uncharacterized protein LOC123445407 n=1 Tax=Hordeum vulgare subsp. vulgare TaxID=112509 RepID=UPI000296111D|nr:uncharacterized protein LOC123445407 [Hordeum vulgare subsp. vulgare]